jgi:L,D-transpeptidase catalytic domain
VTNKEAVSGFSSYCILFYFANFLSARPARGENSLQHIRTYGYLYIDTQLFTHTPEEVVMYSPTVHTRTPYWLFIIYLWLLQIPSIHAQTITVHLDLVHNKPHITYGNIHYPIAAPKLSFMPTCLQSHDVTGTVASIDRHAYWNPTTRTISDARKKGLTLKTTYGPHEQGNALGSRKILVAWHHACIPSTVRIHGTNKPRIVLAQRRASRGCIRMTNRHWNNLASRISVGTRVRITRN